MQDSRQLTNFIDTNVKMKPSVYVFKKKYEFPSFRILRLCFMILKFMVTPARSSNKKLALASLWIKPAGGELVLD